MKKDLISIIIPTLNASSTIFNSISSVLKQSYENWEVIVVDGYSSDDTVSIIKKFQNKKIKIFFLSKKKGLAAARYLGIRKSRGKFIAFLDADDFWKQNKLQHQIKFMKENKILFSATWFAIFSRKLTFNYKNKVEKINFNYFLYNRPICNSSVLIEKNLILKVAKKHRLNIYAEDYLWWLEVLKMNINCYVLKKNLTTINLSSSNRSRNFIKNLKDLYFIYKNINNFNNFKIIKIYFFLIKNTFKKNLFKIRAIYLNN